MPKQITKSSRKSVHIGKKDNYDLQSTSVVKLRRQAVLFKDKNDIKSLSEAFSNFSVVHRSPLVTSSKLSIP